MIVVARVFQMAVLLFMMYNIVSERKRKIGKWKKLTIAKWIFYFCGVASCILSFGVIAELKEIEELNQKHYGVCVLFSIVCITCAYIMFFQKMWYVKYNDEKLIFRNSFGIIKTYPIDELIITEGSRVNRICHNEKTVVKWDSMIMDIKEEIAIYQFFNTGVRRKV